MFASFVLCLPVISNAYSVLTHMAIIDACWKKSIQPVLSKKFPGSTDDQFKDAHAYIYGGAIMPDMGYYPLGTPFFTNLVHYVRTGDFVTNLLNEAKDMNEYAFALGALCHYYADIYGHSIGVNPSVPLVYSKLKEKFGDTVYYEENKVSHIRTEFGIDVLQVAKGNYAPEDYHDFIGFKVSQPVLERAFQKTYGIDIKNIFKSLPLAIGTFRFTVKNFFPVITKIAWASRSSQIKKVNPQATEKSFSYNMSRKEYYANKEQKDNRPGFFAGTFTWVIKFLPKFGPLRAFKFKVPTPEVEKLFLKSFEAVVKNYSASLKSLPNGELDLLNKDFDTGNKTIPGEYELADNSYNKMLLQINRNDFKYTTPSLKSDVLNYYSKAGAVLQKQSCKKQQKINCSIGALKDTKASYQ
ncbi:MAG: hypothetical protein JWQ09_5449 [Segetibacter sp.]|nr:hypothetical protein [Segetibacter sp.]